MKSDFTSPFYIMSAMSAMGAIYGNNAYSCTFISEMMSAISATKKIMTIIVFDRLSCFVS